MDEGINYLMPSTPFFPKLPPPPASHALPPALSINIDYIPFNNGPAMAGAYVCKADKFFPQGLSHPPNFRIIYSLRLIKAPVRPQNTVRPNCSSGKMVILGGAAMARRKRGTGGDGNGVKDFHFEDARRKNNPPAGLSSIRLIFFRCIYSFRFAP